jgi:hypothetical protein
MDSVDFWPGHPLSYTTTKIDVFFNQQFLGSATGFVHKFGSAFGLVTNWHVLSGINPASGLCLSSMGGMPNRIEFHVAVSRKWKEKEKVAEQIHFRAVDLGLIELGMPIWKDDKRADNQNDYAVIPISKYLPELVEEGVTLRAIEGGKVTLKRGAARPSDESTRVPKEDIQHIYPAVGAEVFVLGYPRGLGTNGIFPIWKRASIASEPQGSVTLAGQEYTNLIYVDALTKSGMSGAPVICLPRSGDYFHSDDGVIVEPAQNEPLVVGVYAGRDGVTNDEYELALGRVWKIGSVEELFFKFLHDAE